MKAPIENGCQKSHVSGYSTEDFALQHDDRDYQKVNAEDVVTNVESSAIEGSPHRLAGCQEHSSLRICCCGRVLVAEVKHLVCRFLLEKKNSLHQAKG